VGGGVVVSGDMSYEKILEQDSDLLYNAEQLKEGRPIPRSSAQKSWRTPVYFFAVSWR
jgi:hypothetical protein